MTPLPTTCYTQISQITITGFLGFKVEMSKLIGGSMQGIPWHVLCSLIVGECYFLSMLLTHAFGFTSFDVTCTMNGVVNPTSQSACLALGLLGDGQEWWHYLGQAAHF
jgi:hypothetical protein